MKYPAATLTDIGPNVTLNLPLKLHKRVADRLQIHASGLGIPVEDIASDAVSQAFHDEALNFEETVGAVTALLDLVVEKVALPPDAAGTSAEDDLRNGLRWLSRLVRAQASFAVQDVYYHQEALARLREQSTAARAANGHTVDVPLDDETLARLKEIAASTGQSVENLVLLSVARQFGFAAPSTSKAA